MPVHSQMFKTGFRSPHEKILEMVFGFYLDSSLSEENARESIEVLTDLYEPVPTD